MPRVRMQQVQTLRDLRRLHAVLSVAAQTMFVADASQLPKHAASLSKPSFESAGRIRVLPC